MENHVIYYFTGTGNSLQVARDLAHLTEYADVRAIAEYEDEPIEADKLGIVFPVYCFGLPNMVAKFLKKANIQGNPYIYAVATYGAFPGLALEQAADTLAARGQRLTACFRVPMPGNCITAYGAYSEEKQQKCFDTETVIITNIVRAVAAAEADMDDAKCGWLMRKISKRMYRSMSHARRQDRFYTVDDRCTGCGVCAAHCPAKNIVMENDRPVFQHRCETCMSCIQRCPAQALNYKDKTQKRARYLNPNIHD